MRDLPAANETGKTKILTPDALPSLNNPFIVGVPAPQDHRPKDRFCLHQSGEDGRERGVG